MATSVQKLINYTRINWVKIIKLQCFILYEAYQKINLKFAGKKKIQKLNKMFLLFFQKVIIHIQIHIVMRHCYQDTQPVTHLMNELLLNFKV